jgi:hypothetical protein
MRDEETTLDPDLEWGEGMSGRVDGPVWMWPAGLGGRALAAGRDQSFLSFFLCECTLTTLRVSFNQAFYYLGQNGPFLSTTIILAKF